MGVLRGARPPPSPDSGSSARGASSEPRVTSFEIEGEELAVVSFPVDVTPPTAHLTPSEWEIVDLIRDGHSNREIAKSRGTSSRTVANQIAGLFKKLGVSSRSELVSVLYRPTA